MQQRPASIATQPAVPPPPAPDARRLLARVGSQSLLPTALVVGAYLAFPYVPLAGTSEPGRWLAYASVCAVLAIVGWLLARLAPLALVPRGAVSLVAGGALALSVAATVAAVPIASDLAKVVLAAAVAALLARTVERLWWIVPVSLLVSAADLWSVLSPQGVTNTVITRYEQVVPVATVAVPAAGAGYGEGALLGVVDVLFAGVFLGVALLWGVGLRRTVVAFAVGVTTAIVVDVELLGGRPLPALPFICASVLLAWSRPLWRDVRRQVRG